MDDEVVHRPALQAIEMLVKPLVGAGQQRPLALLAPISYGGVADNLPANGSPGEPEVVRKLGVDLVRAPDNILPFTARACAAPDHDLLVYGQFGSLPRCAVPMTCFSDSRAGAEKDFLPLVIEIGTAVDVIEV